MITPPSYRSLPIFSRLLTVLVVLFGLLACASGDDPTPEQIEFFEKKIRPVLTDHCFECHSDEKQESDLRLDSRESILTGGASGSAVKIDDPDASLLLEVLNYDGDIEMPPDQKLDEEIVEDVRKWIEMGLPWPKKKDSAAPQSKPATMAERVVSHRTNHWAYLPLQSFDHRNTPKDEWSKNEVDRIIRTKQIQNDFAPSLEASRQILTRRLYLLLLGVPPTYEDVRKVSQDPSESWYENLVDRLMTSPRYGERWGRHWLDVARYADTRGYSFQRDRKYPHAYTYRDYVIRSWNEDKPFNQFVKEQLAADQLELGDDLTPLAGLGFLTVGRKFNNIHDDIDDKIDVVFRGLQGLTVACARCHDHKYDAIPTEDYYSLYGVFASSNEGALPYIGNVDQVKKFTKEKATVDAAKNKLNEFLRKQQGTIVHSARSNSRLYFSKVLGFKDQKAREQMGIPDSNNYQLVPKISRAWRDYIRRQANDTHPVWFPWKSLSALKDNPQFEAKAKNLIESWQNTKRKVNPLLIKELASNPPKRRIDIAERYGRVFQSVYTKWKEAGSNDAGLAKLSEAQRQIGIAIFTDSTPTEIKLDQIRAYLSEQAKENYNRLKLAFETQQKKLPNELDRAMVVSDIAKPVEPVVFIRGQAGRRGKRVPRQFVEVISSDRQPFKSGSGRLELAELITRDDNPLTARVIANRVWMGLMGRSLVATPSDFGTRCPQPEQHLLLDFLATHLIENDWSIKSLQRQILTSATFRQSSQNQTEFEQKDVDNKFYWKFNRQRLEFEPLRDSMLFVAGELDLTMGGKSVEITKRPFAKRRAVYGYIDRQDLPNLLRAFDFASPDQSSAQRTKTTVPQQLLFMMNSPFVLQRAYEIAKKVTKDAAAKTIAGELYENILSRAPTGEDVKIVEEFLKRETDNKNRVRNLAQILLLTNEFTFVD